MGPVPASGTPLQPRDTPGIGGRPERRARTNCTHVVLPSPAMSSAPSLLADRFELGDKIGEGSVSVVHAAVDRTNGRTVAIKLGTRAPDGQDAARRRFERAAAALSVIASADVVELTGAGAAP